MCFLNKLYLRCGKICVICSKANFITNITNVTVIYTFSFYNNRHTFTTTDKIFTTKHTYFIKINIDPIAGPKSEILRSRGETVPLKVLKLFFFFLYFLIKCVPFVVKYVQFVVKLSLLQISLMLLEFTYFIFITIDVFITTDTKFTTKHKYFIKTHIGPVAGPKCVPRYPKKT